MTDRIGESSSPAWDVSLAEGGLRFRWRRSADRVVAEWVGLLTLTVDDAGRVTSEVGAAADPLTLRKLQATAAPAFVRALHGKPSLHASAAERDGSAIVCLGESGAGKSTAAARLCDTRGFSLMADDVTGLECSEGTWWVLPTESSHWLERQPRRKEPFDSRSVARARARLAAMVCLRFDEAVATPHLTRLRGASAYAVLAGAAQRFELGEAVWRREMDALASMVERVGLVQIVRSRACPPATTIDLLESTLKGIS